MDRIERARTKASLLKLDTDYLRETHSLFGIPTPEEDEEVDALSDNLLDMVAEGKISKEALLNVAEYFSAYAPKIEHPTRGLTKAYLLQMLGGEGTRLESITRAEMIGELRRRVASGAVSADTLKQLEEIYLQNSISKIKKPETRALVASRILGTKIEEFSSNDLVELSTSKFQSGELTPEEILAIVREAQRETAAAARREVQAPSYQRIETLTRRTLESVKEIGKSLKRVEEKSFEGIFLNLQPGKGDALARFLRESRLVFHHLDDRSETRYEEALSRLQERGFSSRQVIERAFAILCLMALEESLEKTTFDLPLAEFYEILQGEVKRLTFASKPIIYRVREAMLEGMELTPAEFDEYLLECRAKGWLNLVEGAPYSEEESHWLGIEGRKFYYMELVRGE